MQRHGQRQHRPAELGDLPLELVDALGVVVVVAAEDLVLDLVDVLVDGDDGVLVAVDHEVGGPVEHRRRAVHEQVGPPRSSSARTWPKHGLSPWRTVTTKLRPTKIAISLTWTISSWST